MSAVRGKGILSCQRKGEIKVSRKGPSAMRGKWKVCDMGKRETQLAEERRKSLVRGNRILSCQRKEKSTVRGKGHLSVKEKGKVYDQGKKERKSTIRSKWTLGSQRKGEYVPSGEMGHSAVR